MAQPQPLVGAAGLGRGGDHSSSKAAAGAAAAAAAIAAPAKLGETLEAATRLPLPADFAGAVPAATCLALLKRCERLLAKESTVVHVSLHPCMGAGRRRGSQLGACTSSGMPYVTHPHTRTLSIRRWHRVRAQR